MLNKEKMAAILDLGFRITKIGDINDHNIKSTDVEVEIRADVIGIKFNPVGPIDWIPLGNLDSCDMVYYPDSDILVLEDNSTQLSYVCERIEKTTIGFCPTMANFFEMVASKRFKFDTITLKGCLETKIQETQYVKYSKKDGIVSASVSGNGFDKFVSLDCHSRDIGRLVPLRDKVITINRELPESLSINEISLSPTKELFDGIESILSRIRGVNGNTIRIKMLHAMVLPETWGLYHAKPEDKDKSFLLGITDKIIVHEPVIDDVKITESVMRHNGTIDFTLQIRIDDEVKMHVFEASVLSGINQTAKTLLFVNIDNDGRLEIEL